MIQPLEKVCNWITHHVLLKRNLSELDLALTELIFYRKHQMVNANRQTIVLEEINEAVQDIKKALKRDNRRVMSDTSIYLLNKLISRVEGDE